MQATVTVKLSQKNFGLGLKYARKVGGQFNPGSKTWDIPASRNELNAPGMYGWIVVGPAVVSQVNPVCRRCGTYCDGDCN